MQIIGAPGYFFDNGFATHDRPAFTFAMSMIAPISEGSVRLRSSNPTDKVAVSLNIFAEQADLDSMVAAIEAGPRDRGRPVLRSIVGPEITRERRRTRREIERKLRTEPSIRTTRPAQRASEPRAKVWSTGAAGPRCARSAGRRRVGVPVHTAGVTPTPRR